MLVSALPVRAIQESVLNFVVAGQQRAGSSIIQSALCNIKSTICHGDLFFDDYGTPQEREQVRREAHEAYFGKSPVKLPEWLHAEANPWRYLTDTVLDNAINGESKIGVRLLYHHLVRYELYDYLEERYREGDFCLIHVVRNPVACFVSKLQAEREGVWQENASDPVESDIPSSVHVETQELVDFVRQHEAVYRKITASCKDLLEVKYKDLCLNYDQQMERVMEFLELEPQAIPQPTCRRLRNRELQDRISNYHSLRLMVPSEVRSYFDKDVY